MSLAQTQDEHTQMVEVPLNALAKHCGGRKWVCKMIVLKAFGFQTIANLQNKLGPSDLVLLALFVATSRITWVQGIQRK